jgi:hypothetical protein
MGVSEEMVAESNCCLLDETIALITGGKGVPFMI